MAATGAYNPLQITQVIQQEAIGLGAQALQAGRNPAQVVMDVTNARGFAPKPKQPARSVETEQERVARIAKGQEARFSLSQAGGSKAPKNGGMDAKTLANMSDEDFSAFMDKAKKTDLREFMGQQDYFFQIDCIECRDVLALLIRCRIASRSLIMLERLSAMSFTNL